MGENGSYPSCCPLNCSERVFELGFRFIKSPKSGLPVKVSYPGCLGLGLGIELGLGVRVRVRVRQKKKLTPVSIKFLLAEGSILI